MNSTVDGLVADIFKQFSPGQRLKIPVFWDRKNEGDPPESMQKFYGE